ncbi:hypothetical protein [Methylobacterium fujisawaense]|uniref:hypothetical protein n=1 Tax=Methylobacterium fujisawaense TaxID=107400 RepID=UPI00313E0275
MLLTLDELELEALTYRAFVERLRREVLPFSVSERRIRVWKAAELVTFGYQTLEEARRSVRIHDLRRIEYFDRVFSENQEWIYDLCYRIIALYAWSVGFAEPDYAQAVGAATSSVRSGLFVHMPVVGTIVEVGAVSTALAFTGVP